MKLLLKNALIETDNIEQADIWSENKVMIRFVSGEKLQVACGVETKMRAVWGGTADELIEKIRSTDRQNSTKR